MKEFPLFISRRLENKLSLIDHKISTYLLNIQSDRNKKFPITFIDIDEEDSSCITFIQANKAAELLNVEDEKMFEIVTNKTAEFFMEALGGGDIYTSQHGHPHLRSRHFPFTIDEQAREIWLMFYKKTLKDVNFPKEYLKEFWEWIESLSLRMINRRTMMEAPKRYPFENIAKEFGLGEKCES